MNAQPSDLILRTQALSNDVTRPISGSRKVYVTGSRPDLRVPMREIELSQTPKLFGAEINAPFTVYDTSGPYTDVGARIDLSAGLPALRAAAMSASTTIRSPTRRSMTKAGTSCLK